LDKQPNFVFGLAGACADKIQLRFQKRGLAAAEPADFDDARFLRQLAKALNMSIMFFCLDTKTTKKALPSIFNFGRGGQAVQKVEDRSLLLCWFMIHRVGLR
jgi:hypothetical protein